MLICIVVHCLVLTFYILCSSMKIRCLCLFSIRNFLLSIAIWQYLSFSVSPSWYWNSGRVQRSQSQVVLGRRDPWVVTYLLCPSPAMADAATNWCVKHTRNTQRTTWEPRCSMVLWTPGPALEIVDKSGLGSRMVLRYLQWGNITNTCWNGFTKFD